MVQGKCTTMVRLVARLQLAVQISASASEWIVTSGGHDDDVMGSATSWEHDDGARGSSTAAVGGASTSERISTGGEHDDGAVGCCFARRERWEGRFLVRVG